jgi:hypothetical protein
MTARLGTRNPQFPRVSLTIAHRLWPSSSQVMRKQGQPGKLVIDPNIPGFIKVADAMIDQGLM